MDVSGIKAVALSIRSLTMDAVEKAKSGHPGLPLGCAELAAVLYGEVLKHNPYNSKWQNRDRFVLSAGHGSMLLYAVLHLSGYKISLDDIKNFRKLGSVCPGHPEYGVTEGVENTSGPLGQGLGLAVGMAIAETMAAAKYNTKDYKIIDHYTYALVGEGCLEEGVSSEVSSLAGCLKLEKLIVFYDMNKISIDGPTDITFTEDIKKRYEAYNWKVLEGDMYDIEGILDLINEAKKPTGQPSLIILKSIIGKGSPKEGTNAVHGEPLGEENVVKSKINLGLDAKKFFYVDTKAYAYFDKKKPLFQRQEEDWQNTFDAWSKAYPKLKEEYDAALKLEPTGNIPDPTYDIGSMVATRSASCDMISAVGEGYSYFVGGSADLKGSNKTSMKCDNGTYSSKNRVGRSIEYGVREFGMACISAGIGLHGLLRNFCATYLVFCDYMKAAMRLTSIMKLPIIYILTHDSIYVGEDGPTHQPIEQLSSLRSIPNMRVLRPGDAQETVAAWHIAISYKAGPIVLSLTRQKVKVYPKEDTLWQETIKKGAYIVKKGSDNPCVTLLATGSEVNLALDAANLIQKDNVRVVSVLDKKLFEMQDENFKKSITGEARIIVVEAGIKAGWESYVKDPCDLFTIDDFGTSASGNIVAEYFGFTKEKLASLIMKN